MRQVYPMILICMFSASLAAQPSRGVSPPGRIVDNRKPAEPPVAKQGTESGVALLTAIRLTTPSGDPVLREGETGTLVVEVRNLSPSRTIEPDLEFLVGTSWATGSQTIQRSMSAVAPGETGTYRGQIPWNEQFPSGTLTYRVRAVDRRTGAESPTAQVAFRHEQGRTPEKAIAVVQVGASIPNVGAPNPDAIAVVIGNRKYTHPDVPDVDFALTDASVMKQYLIRMLGYREANIIHLENASKTDFELVFGTREEPRGRLHNWVRADRSDVFVYYSGHGAPDVGTRKGYFMPSNADPHYVRIGGYPLDLFYENLSRIPAKSVTVVLDACFSGASQAGMLLRDASPMYIDVEMPLVGLSYNLLTSAAGNQISSWYPDAKHSLFTYYFLRAIRGEADADKDRKITLHEIGEYLNDHVPYMARRLYGREQTPTIRGQMNAVFCTY